jgi:L-aminopeptidase/D-esterase-like protein
MLVHHVDAVLLTGGSAFGLAAADGVVRWLEERGRGFDTGVARVPIVPAAVLFDLGVGDPSVRPGPEEGYAACGAASEEPEEGAVGAGTGSTVAKLHGPARARPGGLAMASAAEQGLTVAALAAVNAFGEIVAEDGTVLAGVLPGDDGDGEEARSRPTNTTIVVVATDAALTRERAHLLAVASHDGLARALRPAHTMWDGDTVFTLATGRSGRTDVPQSLLERVAEDVVADAIRRAATGEGKRA